MNKKRIKFYGLHDLASSHYIEQSINFLQENDLTVVEQDINSIIEHFNILKYVNLGLTVEEIPDLNRKLEQKIGRSLGTIKFENISQIYSLLDQTLIGDFWEIIAKYKLFRKIPNAFFASFLNTKRPQLRQIICNKELVDHYDLEFKDYLISDFMNATILLEHYEIESLSPQKRLYFPASLDYSDINDLLIQYIESDEPSLNYLRVIETIRDRDEIRVSDKTRLLAKRKHIRETEIFFQNNTGIEYGVSVAFEPQDDTILVNQEKNIMKLSYDVNWIIQNLDFNTLLNNFIHLFEFVDSQFRISLISVRSDVQVIEELFDTRAKNNYHTGWSFNIKEQTSNLQLYTYIDILKNHGISIEDLIKWFFSDYMFDFFEIKNFEINVPSNDISFFEKCRILIPEIDCIIKKYNMFVEDSEIDLELLSMSSKPLSISDCKSLFQRKNIYQNSKRFDAICHYFFSDQCMLSYIENDDNHYSCFFELLQNRIVKKNDYNECYHKEIDWLVENNFINISADDEIHLNDYLYISIMFNLFKFESLNYINLPQQLKEKVDSMISEDELIFDCNLFSRSEAQYFNYYLNKKDFGNSRDLRNMYLHGTQPQSEGNIDIHKHNYITILKILILIIIKMNDELHEKYEAI